MEENKSTWLSSSLEAAKPIMWRRDVWQCRGGGETCNSEGSVAAPMKREMANAMQILLYIQYEKQLKSLEEGKSDQKTISKWESPTN